MLGTRTIFVEGLPGAGKGTTAKYVVGELEQRGVPFRLLRERETDHPLNVVGDLHPSGSTTGSRMFAAYTVGVFVEESLARWDAFVCEARGSERVKRSRQLSVPEQRFESCCKRTPIPSRWLSTCPWRR